MSAAEDAPPESTLPTMLRVDSGDPNAEELAALVAVVAVLAARSNPSGGTPSVVPRSGWSSPAQRMRGGHEHGPGAWRANAHPR